ncbi:MAG: hypothetical protein ACHQET_07025 [Chitinophagales bacterium]
MKKIMIIVACFALLSAKAISNPVTDVNQKVLHSFQTTFTHARNVQWFAFSDYYYVSFNQGNFAVRAYYDPRGNLINTMRYYSAQYLPINITLRLEAEYPNQVIKNVTEVCNGDEAVYFVRIDGTKNWRIVKADGNGDLETQEVYDYPVGGE